MVEVGEVWDFVACFLFVSFQRRMDQSLDLQKKKFGGKLCISIDIYSKRSVNEK